MYIQGMSNAAKTYADKIAAARALLADIERKLASHEARAAKRPDDWGFVGDVGEVAGRLADVSEFLGR